MIEITNLTANLINGEFLKRVVKKVLKEENRKKKSLSIAFVSSGTIKKLNKKYLKRNKVTDILSFPELKTKVKYLQKFENLGEIVICLAEVKKNAKRFKNPLRKELARVLIHGLLHLLDYDHEKPSTRAKLGAGPVPHRNKVSGAGSKIKAKKMREKENHYLEKIIKNG